MIQNENTYHDGYYDKHNDYSTQEYHDIFESDDWGDEEPNDIGDEEPNDVGDEEMSLKDLLTLTKERDLLFCVSLSGNSDDCHFHKDDNANKGNLNDSNVEVPSIINQTIIDHVIFDKILESSLA
nr:ulp1 protease family, C-terminal catalytic domain-containing protein [Tanacetum cinerariifolium]